MFSSKLAFCCIVALHFTSSGASPVQETNALQSAEFEALEPYAATERGARALYITLSTQASASFVSGGVLYIIITGSNIVNTVTISDSPTQGASFVAPNGRLYMTFTGSNAQTRVNYNGTPYQPAIDFLSIKVVGSNTHNNINVGGSSVTASGTLRIGVDGSNNINSMVINDPSLRPADRRLQIIINGSNNVNSIIVNGSPRQT